jgi:hypothetical protein
MHVRREARLVDDHRCGVELSLAPTPVKSSQKNRPDAPYEGLPPNRWMPGTNAKCPSTPGMGAALDTWWESPHIIVGVPMSTGASRIEAAVWVDPCLKLPNDAALPNHCRCGHDCSSRTVTNGVVQCEWRHNANQFCGHGGSRRSKSVHPVRDNGSECQGRNRGSGLPSLLRARVPGGLSRKHHSAGSKGRHGLGASARSGVEGRLG